MIEISIDQFASKTMLNFMRNGSEIVNRGIDNGIGILGQNLTNKAKMLAPRKRGDLARSITGKKFPLKYVAGTNKVYAKIQEYGGTIHAKNGPFLHWKDERGWHKAPRVTIKPYRGTGYFRPAMKFIAKKAGQIIANEVKKALNL